MDVNFFVLGAKDQGGGERRPDICLISSSEISGAVAVPGGVTVPGGQSELMATVWASKDADLGIASRYWQDGDQMHFGGTTAIR
jgi:hypothetical protein